MSEELIVKCPSCGSEHAVIKARRKSTVSYQCGQCKVYYSLPNEYFRRSDEEELIIQWDKDGENNATVTANAPSLEAALKSFKVDTEDWEVLKYKVEERESAKPQAEGGGKQSLYKITMDVQKRQPSEVFPAIQPVYVKNPKRIIPKSHKGGMKRAVILSDAHLGYTRDMVTGKLKPFHDREAWGVIFAVLQDLKPDLIIINGDMLDCAELTTKFAREPNVYFTFQPTLYEAKWILAQIRNICRDAQIIFIEGNHEQRLPNFMVNHFNAAFDVNAVDSRYPALSVPALLNLDELDIEWVGDYPDGGHWINENLFVRHGHLSKSRAGATAEAYLEHARCSVISGHIHRAERAARRMHHHDGPREYFAECFGMVGSTKETPGHTKYTNWNQGFGVVYYEEGNGAFSTVPVSIHSSASAVFNGNYYYGEDYADQLREETGWEAF